MRSDLIAYIDTDSLAHNYRALRACCRPGVKLCAPLKANAYGHDIRIVAPVLQEAGADYGAVATLHEAIELRDTGWEKPILVLGNVLAVADDAERRERIDAFVDYDLTATIVDIETIRHITRAEPPKPIPVHLKLDTGMGRMGAMPESFGELLAAAKAASSIRIEGIYSHFATADFEQRDLVARQFNVFTEALRTHKDELPPGLIRHMANSAATITLPEANFDMVRPGLALYGYVPADRMAAEIDLRPILRLASHLTAVKQLPSGHCVGYGQTFTTKRATRLGIVPVGYFDGFMRALSNAATFSTPSGDVLVIGRISMDQLAVDLTDLPSAKPGDEITLIDPRPDRPNSVAALARRLGTIPYEITCLLGNRIQRVGIGSYRPAPSFSHTRS